MVSSYKKGLKRVLVYYFLGIIVMVVVHQITGWQNKTVMPRSMLIPVFLLMIGLPWSLLNVLGLACPAKKYQNSAELLIHGLVFFTAAGLIYFLRISI